MSFLKRIFGGNKPETRPAPRAPKAEAGLSPHLALGAGCYWGTEKYVRDNFQRKFPKSIKSCAVGFMPSNDSPPVENPSYEQVCTGKSGHVEVLIVQLNKPERHYEELIRFFFQFHDPTTKNRQGNDVGFQYASFIFCGDEQQYQIATKVRNELQNLLSAGAIRGAYAKKQITTLIGPLKPFTAAHEEHQRFLEKQPNGYCNHRIRFKEWPELVPPEGGGEEEKGQGEGEGQEKETALDTATKNG